MNKDNNLIPLSQLTKNEQRKIARKGGKASARARRKRKTFKELIDAYLAKNVNAESKVTFAEAIVASLINEALRGKNPAKAFETIRDTVGEKPVEKQEQNVDANLVFSWAIAKRKKKEAEQ